jgi:hypothetical protein
MRGTLLAAISLVLGIGVSAHPQTKNRSKTTTLDAAPDPPDANPQYFPKDTFHDSIESGSFKNFTARWYSKHLRAMNEPSLSVDSKDKTLVAYRFLWLRTFHHPIAIRLTIRSDGTGLLTGKMTSGHGGYEPGTLSQNNSFEVSKSQIQQFLDLLQKTAFWTLQTENGEVGDDGAVWLLKGVQGGNYHVVDRWSPAKDDFSRVCLYLLELSKISVPGKEIY